MDVLQVAPGLWRWTGWHEEWKQDVGCVFYQAPDAVVLVDPIVPPEDTQRFWRALDRDVERAGVPVHVLITIFWHTRSTRAIVDRYRGRLWAPTRGRAPIARRAGEVSDVFRVGDPLPAGIQSFPTGRGTEVVFWIAEHGALVPGDVLLGDGEGGLRLCPQPWLPASIKHDQLRRALRPLVELPVKSVLVSHGEPVLRGGRGALARALDHAPRA